MSDEQQQDWRSRSDAQWHRQLDADAFAGLTSWHRWRDLFALAHVAVSHRPGFPVEIGSLSGELARGGKAA